MESACQQWGGTHFLLHRLKLAPTAILE
ncbi:hypothetical protein A2U01_0107040 [Trifolium medium]|uniref:Uncharacterized protein n=1 Tax=Trifolium medium TaxID=97028 RepID=A0A392VFN3_9FABA|nr:hypothetical protein [Trifolium medium]